jgi:hypothetical protein
LQRLSEGLNRYRADTGDTQIRYRLIQRFELTCEISLKMLKRNLESVFADPAAPATSPWRWR